MSIRVARSTGRVITRRDGRTKMEIFDDGSERHLGGHRRYGKARRAELRRAKARA